MKKMLHGLAVVALVGGFAGPVAAQAPAGLSGDLVKATSGAETKILGLAEAMSETQYGWRPGAGVRSVGEVLMHIAAENYFLPALLGVPAPAATKINATDYPAVQAFENQKLSREATIAELKTLFEHYRRALAQVPESRMNETMKAFGQEFSVRSFMIGSTTHLHEHLGQMIAYARTNGVVPPWSR